RTLHAPAHLDLDRLVRCRGAALGGVGRVRAARRMVGLRERAVLRRRRCAVRRRIRLSADALPPARARAARDADRDGREGPPARLSPGVAVSTFADAARALAATLPDARSALLLCEDRVRFTLALVALSMRGTR